jgi:hypothetical protein
MKKKPNWPRGVELSGNPLDEGSEDNTFTGIRVFGKGGLMLFSK